jgi:hypothetical protein
MMGSARDVAVRGAITLLLGLIAASSVSATPMRMPEVKLTAHGLAILEQQFAEIPAVGIVAALSEVTCEEPRILVSADPPVEAYCWVAAGCADNGYFAFYLQENGQVWAPMGLGRLLAERCPEAISDDANRRALVGEYEDELQRLGAWLHAGLEK